MMNNDKPESRLPGATDDCAGWEAALVDLMDGMLPEKEEASFRAHAAQCAACRTMLEECGHGREWARLLHDTPPAVPKALLGKILDGTLGGNSPVDSLASGQSSQGMLLPGGDMLMMPSSPVWSMRGQRQARVLMTSAMAFFSIALTLSISGVHLGDVAAALRAPATIEASATRQFFDTKRQVVSFYDNLRLVHEVEATVDDLRQTSNRDTHSRQGQPQPSASREPEALFAPLLASRQAETKAFNNSRIQAEERTTL